jgi:hypothetical protein
MRRESEYEHAPVAELEPHRIEGEDFDLRFLLTKPTTGFWLSFSSDGMSMTWNWRGSPATYLWDEQMQAYVHELSNGNLRVCRFYTDSSGRTWMESSTIDDDDGTTYDTPDAECVPRA